jgi:COMM domain
LNNNRKPHVGWFVQLTLSSDRMANVWQPLLNLEFDVDTRGEKRFVHVELDSDELKKLVTSLESADRVSS